MHNDAATLLLGFRAFFRGVFRLALAKIRVLLVKALHPSGAVNQLLLAGEKGMATRTDFHVQHAVFGRGARLE